jgi:hypothetical protein
MNKTAKIVIWLTLVALSAWGMWGAGTYIGFNSITGVNITLPVLALFLLLVSLIVIGYALFGGAIWPLSVSVIVGLAFLFWYGFTLLNLIGAGIMLLLNLESYRHVRSDMANRLRINTHNFMKAGLLPVVMGIFIATSFAAYQSPLALELQNRSQLPSQTKSFFLQITEKFIGPQLDSNSQGERQNMINQIVNQTFQETNNLLKSYFKYAPPLIAFGLFLILWGLSWLFVWMAVMVGVIIFWTMKKTRVVRIEKGQIEVEVLVV